jgi:hypothetical protein
MVATMVNQQLSDVATSTTIIIQGTSCPTNQSFTAVYRGNKHFS